MIKNAHVLDAEDFKKVFSHHLYSIGQSYSPLGLNFVAGSGKLARKKMAAIEHRCFFLATH